jgi:hypothetical protein
VKVIVAEAEGPEMGRQGAENEHALVLEEPDGARLDGFLGRAGAGLADLVLVPGQLLVQLLDLLVHRLAPLVYLPDRTIRRASETGS